MLETMVENRLEKIESLVSDIRVEIAESRVNLEAIENHLRALNGRTGKSEDRITTIENARRDEAAEARGQARAYAVVGTIGAAAGSLLTWLLSNLPGLLHMGGKP